MTFLSHSVRDFRLKMMRDLMKRDRLDALIFTTADFFQFATNFHVDVQPWERPILACVTLEGEPQAIMNELSTHHMMMAKERGHVWVKDVQFYAEHPKVAERQFLLPQLPEMIAEFLRKLGLSSSRIGVDGSFSALTRAAATLPELKLIPSLEGMRTLRWVKHAEELEVMREAASLSDFVQERYRENIRPGRLVQELDYQMAVCMVEEGCPPISGSQSGSHAVLDTERSCLGLAPWRRRVLRGQDQAGRCARQHRDPAVERYSRGERAHLVCRRALGRSAQVLRSRTCRE